MKPEYENEIMQIISKMSKEELEEDVECQLILKVRSLRLNRENIPREELSNGKYQSSYRKLMDEIVDLSRKYVGKKLSWRIKLRGLDLMNDEDYNKCCDELISMINQDKINPQYYFDLITESYDVLDKGNDFLEGYLDRLIAVYGYPYLQKYFFEDENGWHIKTDKKDILGEDYQNYTWNADSNCWISKDNGSISRFLAPNREYVFTLEAA